MIALTELQNDAIVEIFNIGVGQAADTLSQMVLEHVSLSVPSVLFLTRKQALETFNGDPTRRVCGVIQHFHGEFSTEAILMFPEEKSLELVRLAIGEQLPFEQMTDLEQEAMTEIGNIILNSCIGAMANLFQSEFHSGLPVFKVGSIAQILRLTDDSPQHNPEDLVLMLLINFGLERHDISGYVTFILDVASFNGLTTQIDRFIGQIPQ